jgi:hypothetical protein
MAAAIETAGLPEDWVLHGLRKIEPRPNFSAMQ